MLSAVMVWQVVFCSQERRPLLGSIHQSLDTGLPSAPGPAALASSLRLSASSCVPKFFWLWVSPYCVSLRCSPPHKGLEILQILWRWFSRSSVSNKDHVKTQTKGLNGLYVCHNISNKPIITGWSHSPSCLQILKKWSWGVLKSDNLIFK